MTAARSRSETSGRVRDRERCWWAAARHVSTSAADIAADGGGLIGAAHAGCYSMFLSALASDAGTAPTSVETTATVNLDMSGDAPRISRIALTTVAQVPGVSDDDFQQLAADAKANCPVSAALASVPEVTVDATLQG